MTDEQFAQMLRDAAKAPDLPGESAEVADARVRAACAPLSADFEARVMGALEDVLVPAPNNIFRPRFRRSTVAWGAGFAVAAGIAATVLLPRLLPNTTAWPELPAYEGSASGGIAQVRSATTKQALTLTPTSRVELLARPAEQVTAPVEASVLAQCGGAARPVTAEVQVSSSGAVRAVVLGSQMPQECGSGGTLLLAVYRPLGLEDALRQVDSPETAKPDALARLLRFGFSVSNTHTLP